MNIHLAENHNKEEWDRYVQTHPETSPYHLWAWKKSVEEAYGHKGYYFFAEKNSKMCGIMPLIHMKLPFLQNQLVSLPYCDIGGTLVDSPEIANRLLDEAVSIGKKLGATKVEIRSRSSNDRSGQTPPASSKVSMLLNLPGSSRKLWDSFRSKLRSQVRKAEKNGLTFQYGAVSNIDDFYNVFSRNMHELGSPVHSKKWLKAVLSNYGDMSKMGLVFLEKQPVGCAIILCCGRTACIPWASTLREFNSLGPNMLLYWKLLEFYADNEFDIFDFGRSTVDEGTYKFKAQWGAEPSPLKWDVVYSATAKKQTSPGRQGTRKQAEKIWRNTPAGFACFLGPIIRKYISL